MPSSSEYLGPESPLVAALPGYTPRAQQALMAETVADSLLKREQLIIEAGTGTGKTFAYLLPALLSGTRTIVSTGTRALQDQLFHRDLPVLTEIIGRPLRIAILKGRSNYLCRQRLDSVGERKDAQIFKRELASIVRWSRGSSTGDIREVVDVAETSGVWPSVTSTLDNCVGGKCEQYDSCFVVKARRTAQAADLVVVNHHLLLADLAMKESGFDQFLPGADAFIVDEAHQLPAIAAQFFGIRFSTRAVGNLLDEVEVEAMTRGGPVMRSAVQELRTSLLKFRDCAPREPGRYEFSNVSSKILPGLANLRDAMTALYDALLPLSELSPALEMLSLRFYERLLEINQFNNLDDFHGMRWLDVARQSLSLNLTPLDSSEKTRALLETQNAAWIMTSATLAVGEDFSHFSSRMGLTDAHTVKLASPYDLEARSLIYLPVDMPAPAAAGYTKAVMQVVDDLAGLTKGGIFVLFTSYRALNEAADLPIVRRLGKHREILVQGTAPRDALLSRFREHGNAILLATQTFWEGVDVKGTALTSVVIDKLPFTSPADPLLQARLAYLKQQGLNGFSEHQLPQAVLSLKQGAGRLIRDASDYGVVTLCDPRIQQKSYGRAFLKALQPMPACNDLNQIRRFFAAMEA